MEYFVVTNSFAAPFFSDMGQQYVEAESPAEALEIAAREYSHPCGLYSAGAFSSSDAKNKGEKPLAMWLCNAEIELRRITKGMDGYSVYSGRPGEYKINGKLHRVADPKAGRVVQP